MWEGKQSLCVKIKVYQDFKRFKGLQDFDRDFKRLEGVRDFDQDYGD